MKSPAVRIVTLRDRIDALTRRERMLVTVAGAALLFFLLYLLFWRGAEQDGPVELADAPPAPATIAPAPVPPTASVSPFPTPVVTAPVASVTATSGLTLQGVSGGGPGGGAALVQFGNGAQRLVRIGREIAPGTVLKSVGLTHAIVSSSGGDLRLDLNRPGATAVTAVAGAMSAPVQPAARAEQAETLGLRLGLIPRKIGGRTSGYTVRPGAGLSRLARAGLQSGDVITRVNGSELDEERLLELSSQMTNSARMDLDVIRGGRTMKLTFVPEQMR